MKEILNYLVVILTCILIIAIGGAVINRVKISYCEKLNGKVFYNIDSKYTSCIIPKK